MAISGLPLKGNLDSSVVFVEFSDYECPFCAKYATGVGIELDRKYVTAGRIVHAFANNPLDMHPNAKHAAFAAACAGAQGKYWEARDALFGRKPKSESEILSVIGPLVKDPRQLDVCVKTQPDEIRKQIASDMQYAQKFGLTGTPSFGIGLLQPDGNIAFRKFVIGAQPLAVFEEALDEALRDAGD